MRETNADNADNAEVVAVPVPEGCRINARGHYVPESMIDELDVMRDDLVLNLVSRWVEHNHLLSELKQYAMGEIMAFCDVSAMQYNAPLGGNKGNLQLMSFDGQFKVKVQVHEYIVFDERLTVAKSLVDECIAEWSKGSSDEIKVLVNDAFDTDSSGNVSTSKILALRRIKIEDERWLGAMKALADCMTIAGSKSYVRVYKRIGKDNRWQAVVLDMAAI